MSKRASLRTAESAIAYWLRQKGLVSVQDLAERSGVPERELEHVIYQTGDSTFGTEPFMYQEPTRVIAEYLEMTPESLFGTDPRWEESKAWKGTLLNRYLQKPIKGQDLEK